LALAPVVLLRVEIVVTSPGARAGFAAGSNTPLRKRAGA
jgi:hypothetical protein